MTSTEFRSTLKEAGRIILAGTVLGLLYAGVMGKGVFGPSADGTPSPGAESDFSPVYADFADALRLFESGEALFIDTRHEYDYALGHIFGAVNLPLKEFEERKSVLASVPRDKAIVTYCDGQECNSSLDVANKLSGAGFSDVHFFFGGWTEWQANNSPTEAGQ